MRRGVPALALLATAGCVAPRDAPPRAAVPLAAPADPPAAPLPVPVPAFSWSGDLVQGGLIRGRAPAGAVAATLDGTALPLASDGGFVAGFDRDAGPAATLAATLADGRRVTQPLAIAPRAWRIERVDAPYRAGRTDAQFAAARPAEIAAIAAARARVTDAAGWRQRLRWPATGRQSGWFGAQRVYRGRPGSYHSGADVAVPAGTPVLAPADGVVILAAARPFTLEGHLLMIDHGQGLNTALLHLSRLDVAAGDRVRQGQALGLSGATGRATGPHLHWSVQWRGAKLDPVLAAGPPPAERR